MNEKLLNFILNFLKWVRHNRLSLAAVIVSIISLYQTYDFNSQQDARWDSLNQPRFDITSTYFVAFEELDGNLALSRDWGYNPVLFSVIKDGVHTNLYRLYNDLVFWDSNANRRITGSKTIRTKGDAEIEALRLKLDNVIILKHFQVQFNFRNVGQLPANNVTVKIDQVMGEGESSTKNWFSSNSAQREVVGGQEFNAVTDIYTTLDASLPEELHFRITLDYEFAGKRLSKVMLVNYESNRNYWTWRG